MGQEKGKEEVIKEYLAGGISLRELSAKHGMKSSTLHRWVKSYESGAMARRRERKAAMAGMPTDVRKLQQELHEARLQAKLYETMIRIAEEEMGIPIRKKSGAK